MLARTTTVTLVALFAIFLTRAQSQTEQQQQDANKTEQQQQSGVDEILKDTFQLLDQLDQKLAQVKNKTPNAMMRDNLRALSDRDEPNNQQNLRSLSEEESMEEALLRLADGFSSGRQLVDQIGGAASQLSEEQVLSEMGSGHHQQPQQRKKSGRQLSQTPTPHGGANQVNSGPSDEHQLVASDSTERHIKFTLDLMHSIFFSQSYTAKTNLVDSFLISPLSIQMVLMMMHLGARGQTRREIGQCLHLAASSEPILASELLAPKLKRRHQQSITSSSSPNEHKQHQQQSMAKSTPAIGIRQQHQHSNGAVATNPHELFGGAVRNLLKDPSVTRGLTSANQIFLQKNLPLSSQYESAIRHYYAADVKLVDFQQHQQQTTASSSASSAAASSPLTVTTTAKAQDVTNSSSSQDKENSNNANVQQMINDWVERQTKGKISNFLSSPISTSTLMMAINVLYFKGDWQYKFDPSDTQTDALFTKANGKSVKLPMMVGRLPLAFAHDPVMKTSVIELPYKAQRLGLFLLLPDEVSGIFHTMQALNSTSFANLISSMRKSPSSILDGASGINVRIPKFNIESSPRLSQILSQQLGLKKLFSPDMADLSAMFAPHLPANSKHRATSTNGSLSSASAHDSPQPLQVGLDELLHKAVLQVDEQGSVAAASSATVVERVGLFNSNYFEADHPFLLFLMDKQTGLVLFSGAFAGSSNSSEAQQRH